MTCSRALTFLSFASLLSLGCSSGPAPVALEEVPDALAEAFCAQFTECAAGRATGGEESYLILSRTFSELCPRIITRQFGSLDYLSDAVAAGRVLYDGAAARRCLTEITESCSLQLGFDLFPACREAFVGNIPVGGNCSLREECEPGSRCEAQLVGDLCDGECVPRLPIGSACSEDSECELPEGVVGLAQCRDNGGIEDVCVALELQTGLGEGELCGRTDDTGVERRYGACAADFFCDDPDDDGEGTCRAPLAEGELCQVRQACAEGSVCLAMGMNHRCTAITVATQVGDACDDVVSLCDYTARLECSGGSCVAFAPGACEQHYHCASGEYCDDVSETCEALRDVGAECDTGNECGSGACRDDGTMTGTSRCAERVRCG